MRKTIGAFSFSIDLGGWPMLLTIAKPLNQAIMQEMRVDERDLDDLIYGLKQARREIRKTTKRQENPR